MRKSNSFLLLGLSVLALSACGSSDKEHWGSVDDIVVNNRGVVPAKKVTSTEEKLADVKKEVNQVIDAKAKTPVTEMQTKSMEAAVEAASDEVVAKTETKVKTEVAEKALEEIPTPVTKTVEKVIEPVAQPMSNTVMVQPPELRVKEEKKPLAPTNMAGDLPPNAKPGECYAKVLIPAKVQGTEETVQVSEEQKVLARIIPAQYEIERERVLVKEARQVWKPGRGAQEKVNQTTGEILCLVEEPAVYKTIEKRILVAPERPEYKIIPAQFEKIMRTETIEAERLEWRRILCETNVTPAVIRSLQSALNKKGFDAGKVDGEYGYRTNQAITAYQRKNGLAMNGLTYETIEHLGIKLAGM
tara:strand:- start:311 stop:1384 length:1074 start_codon:yes stop_codon:yes gene_type:complete